MSLIWSLACQTAVEEYRGPSLKGHCREDTPLERHKFLGASTLDVCNTVKPVLRDHCQERPLVLKDHILLAESQHFNATEPVTKDHLS